MTEWDLGRGKTLHFYDHLYHEIYNEREDQRAKVLADLGEGTFVQSVHNSYIQLRYIFSYGMR